MPKKRQIHTRPPGDPPSLKARLLDAGAELLQSTAPLKRFDVYVVGFHCARHAPQQQMEAHHYCRLVTQEFLQCVIFDGNTESANLIGVEYIISERLFEGLPAEERPYWHPHNYEVFSGQLVAPGLPKVAERELMKVLVNSYGKTWHTWHTGRYDEGPESGHDLPLGEATLMWSFNRDGEGDEAMERHRNEHMGLDIEQKRRDRQQFVERAHPQHGVDTLKGSFPDAVEGPPPGVRDAASGGPEHK